MRNRATKSARVLVLGAALMSCGGAGPTATEEAAAAGASEILNGAASTDKRIVGLQMTYDVVGAPGQTVTTICTGTPIGCGANKTVILTAAHCVRPVRIDAALNQFNFRKVEVTADADSSKGLVAVSRVDQHPQYSNVNDIDINDIAILVVPSKMNVTCVDINREVLRSERMSNLQIGGYGVNVNVPTTGPTAQPATGAGFRRSAAATFRTALSFHYQSALGSTVNDTRRTCQGDSGGPTFATIGGVTKVLGVVSFGGNRMAPATSCGDDFNGSYNVRADMHPEFIDSVLEREGFLSASAFFDVLGHPARDEIVFMNRAGNISGFPDGSFKPDEPVTRAQFATILAQTFLRDVPQLATLPKDVLSTNFAALSIRRVIQAGFMRGFPDGTFGPDKQVTRQDVLVALVNGLSVPTRRNSSQAALAVQFPSDADQVSNYAKDAAARAFGWGILRNERLIARGSRVVRGGGLRPLASATRAEVASFIWWARIGANTSPLADLDSDGVLDRVDFCEAEAGANPDGCP